MRLTIYTEIYIYINYSNKWFKNILIAYKIIIIYIFNIGFI